MELGYWYEYPLVGKIVPQNMKHTSMDTHIGNTRNSLALYIIERSPPHSNSINQQGEIQSLKICSTTSTDDQKEISEPAQLERVAHYAIFVNLGHYSSASLLTHYPGMYDFSL